MTNETKFQRSTFGNALFGFAIANAKAEAEELAPRRELMHGEPDPDKKPETRDVPYRDGHEIEEHPVWGREDGEWY